MDRYISLRYKGLGVAKINQESIHPSTTVGHVYLVKGTVYADREYEVDTQKWTRTCTVSRTGYPSGEPCKHQHAVPNKLNITAPKLLPYFNADGCYLHALIAVGQHRVGDKSFYASLKETAPPNVQAPAYNPTNSVEMADDTTNNTMDTDTAGDQTTYKLTLTAIYTDNDNIIVMYTDNYIYNMIVLLVYILTYCWCNCIGT